MQPAQSNFFFVQASVSLLREVSRSLPFTIPGAENITTFFLMYRSANRAKQEMGQILPNQHHNRFLDNKASLDDQIASFLRGEIKSSDIKTAFSEWSQRTIVPIYQEMTFEKGISFLKGLGILADTALSLKGYIPKFSMIQSIAYTGTILRAVASLSVLSAELKNIPSILSVSDNRDGVIEQLITSFNTKATIEDFDAMIKNYDEHIRQADTNVADQDQFARLQNCAIQDKATLKLTGTSQEFTRAKAYLTEERKAFKNSPDEIKPEREVKTQYKTFLESRTNEQLQAYLDNKRHSITSKMNLRISQTVSLVASHLLSSIVKYYAPKNTYAILADRFLRIASLALCVREGYRKNIAKDLVITVS